MTHFGYDCDDYMDAAECERPRKCTCTRVPLHLADCPPEADCPIHGDERDEDGEDA